MVNLHRVARPQAVEQAAEKARAEDAAAEAAAKAEAAAAEGDEAKPMEGVEGGKEEEEEQLPPPPAKPSEAAEDDKASRTSHRSSSIPAHVLIRSGRGSSAVQDAASQVAISTWVFLYWTPCQA